MEKNNKRTVNAWCMYDWANSVYSLTITTAVFPDYYLGVTENYPLINFLGWEVKNTALYPFALSASFLIAAFLSPFLTSIADYTGRKKMFMQFFCYLGSFSCAYLYFFTEDTILLSVFAFMAAGIGYSGSIVFYNSFLPEIVTEDKIDKTSARGFAFGYIGSVILLIANLVMIMNNDWFGITKGYAVRISFLTVGLWWFAFAQYTFAVLPSRSHRKETKGNWLFNGLKELQKVIKELKWQSWLKTFLTGFFLYNLGVQTIMYMATLFGKNELKLPTSDLIIAILLIQVLAIPGANLFAWISGKYGNIKSLSIILFIWIGVCIGAYFVKEGTQFYSLAVVVGFIMGGVQSMSRSTYAKLIPEDTKDNASYFSFYDVADKISTFTGTLIFGLVTNYSDSMRNNALVLAVFFIAGLLVITRIPSLKIYAIKSR
jgi:UMF1 family MFS transporter